VLNAAAYTAVDRAESEPELAAEANAIGPSYLAQACAMRRVPLLHLSTDFVFDGTSRVPYAEADPVRPLGVYGLTKAQGEDAVRAAGGEAWIVRTSWVFGPEGTNFPRSILRAWLAGKPLRVVDDQKGCPTYAPALAERLLDLVERRILPGTYHLTGPDERTWRGLAREVTTGYALRHGLEPPEIEPIATADWPTAAKRPAYSVLSNDQIHAAGVSPMPSLAESIADFVDRYRT
jgi:dTDP-4-dehydrorhamnose reductase